MTQFAVIVMGVTGSGKSTVGAAIARRLGCPFLDADDLHTQAARDQMTAGVPLTDADREPWLRTVTERINETGTDSVVVACSALRRTYRDLLRREARRPVMFVHLDGNAELLAARLARRSGHFMPPELLRSQLDTLEPLTPDETGVVLAFEDEPEVVASAAVAWLDGVTRQA